MPERPPELLDRLWHDVPVSLPPVDLVAVARNSRTRRRRLTGALSAAVVFSVLAATALAVSTDRTTETQLGPPFAHRWVGIGNAVVAVPSDWGTDAATCNAPTRDTVFFPYPQDCVGVARPVSSLQISSRKFANDWMSPTHPADTLDGSPLRESTLTCGRRTEVTLPGSPCIQEFALPAEHAWFRVTTVGPGARPLAEQIRASLRLLPKGRTTVPDTAAFVQSVNHLRRTMLAAGLVPQIHGHWTCAIGTCGRAVRSNPSAGSVVPLGTTIDIQLQQSSP